MKSRMIIVTALWGRAELTNLVLDYYRRMKLFFPPDTIQLLCVGSEGETSRQLAESNGWDYIEAPNAPLSQKFNRLFEGTKSYEFDILMLVGSDDLISSDIIWWYVDNVRADHANLVGLKDLLFYSIGADQMIMFPGYPLPSPRTIGAGRCFSRRILEIMSYRPWADEILPRGLDSASTAQMRKKGIGEEAHTMDELGGIGIDVKDQMVTLTQWERLLPLSHSLVVDDVPGLFAHHFGSDEMFLRLRALKKPFIFVPTENYWVDIIGESHPLCGQKIQVSGEVAIELVIKKLIAHP